MRKLDRGIACLQFIPQLPNTEIILADMGIMKKHDGTITELGLPVFEIMSDSFIGMQAIDMQDVNRPILKMRNGRIESHPKQGGNIGVLNAYIGLKGIVDVLAVSTCMGVTFPSINGKAAGRQLQQVYRLAEGVERVARMGPQFNDQARLGEFH